MELIDLLPEQKDTLVRAPSAVYLLVSVADGEIDEQELAAFQAYLQGTRSRVLRLVAASGLVSPGRLIGEIRRIDGGPDGVLERAANIVAHHYEPEDAKVFCDDLLGLGVAVARASGGIAGVTDPIAECERRALSRVSTALGMS